MTHCPVSGEVGRLIRLIYERLDSPLCKPIGMCCVDLVPPVTFPKITYEQSSTLQFARDYFGVKLLSKWKGWNTDSKLAKNNALVTWLSDEEKCAETNRRIRGLMNGTGFPGSYLTTVISTAQEKISQVLGRFDVRKVLSDCAWGPGATSTISRRAFRDQKLTRRMSVTTSCLPYMKALIESNPNWIEAITGQYPEGAVSLMKDFWEIVDSSKWTTVPKKFDIDRCIDIQPTGNIFVQRGTGNYIRKRLLRFGLDLTSQETNQYLAFCAIFEGRATVDLQSASDTISLELITLLLPPEWVDYLHKIRTKYSYAKNDFGRKRLEKFSAMGNGFTFELETLIFYGLASAVSELSGVLCSSVCVYGDDIIIDARVYDDLVYVFNYCGFSINQDKSFRSGPFFESCGKHYHMSDDVTPAYQKNLINSPEECIRFHNRIVRWSAHIEKDPWYFDEALVGLHALYYELCSYSARNRPLPVIGLGTEGDDGFICPEECISRDKNGGYYAYALRYVPVKFSRNNKAYLCLALTHKLRNSDPRGYVSEPMGGGFRLKLTYHYR